MLLTPLSSFLTPTVALVPHKYLHCVLVLMMPCSRSCQERIKNFGRSSVGLISTYCRVAAQEWRKLIKMSKQKSNELKKLGAIRRG
jgi:predicted component of type VI protein secretion system